MVSAETRSVVERAKQLYDERLRTELESQHRDRFVAIEPESGEYFLADTFDEAVRSARAKYPDRMTFTLRIGHRAAFHIVGRFQTDVPDVPAELQEEFDAWYQASDRALALIEEL